MYKLEALPFSYQELEPYLNTHAVGIHYHKHHQNYLNKLNELLLKNKYPFNIRLEDIYKYINYFNEEYKEDILFNLGGVLNHDLYWKSINRNKRKNLEGTLLKEILRVYQTYDNFKDEFIKQALLLKGSGYTSLVMKKDKTIMIMNTKNQDSPLFYGYTPLFTIDMWEHAYYLDYQNNKKEYLENMFIIADYSYANERYNVLMK